MTETIRDTGAYERILFCTDFSENAEFAFDYALDASVRRPGSILYIFHVIPEPDAQFWKTYLYEVEDV
ncbi:MAG TPA: universal stress protein, partial [Candidatus Hydrogenedentes bacterium]|nr:universal stress protein [Candidatus Hydrogenedentota bacterium]